jgi:TatD DNase family protein
MFIDTHAHLSFPEFADDLPQVIERAHAADVQRIVSVTTDLASAQRTLAIAERFPNVFVALGLHPSDASPLSLKLLQDMVPLADNPKVVAIGETGLDYHRLPAASGGLGSSRAATESGSLSSRNRETIKQQQRDLFLAHLKLAMERRLPAVIHNRDADADTLQILRAHTENLPKGWRPCGVMHCFAGDAKFALDCIEIGLLISFTGILTFKNAATLHDVAKKVSLDQVLLETDCPYLAPVPHRGKRNEPSYIPLIAQALAQIKGVSVDDVARATTENARRLFQFNDTGG